MLEVTKYLHMLECSRRPVDDPTFKPMYLEKNYRESERQLKKYLDKMGWYRRDSDTVHGCTSPNEVQPDEIVGQKPEMWRTRLEGVWRGSSFSQRNVEGLDFSTLLQVPSTKGARLLKALMALEPGLARMSKYNVKIIEKAGTPLSRMFQRIHVPEVCHLPDCQVCLNKEENKPSKCRSSNIVYEATCLECLDQCIQGKRSKESVGKYIGESSRTLAERCREHIAGAGNIEYDNFIVKHWVSVHSDLTSFPKMRFKVLKTFQDPLSRLATESVLIDILANMNSKSEFRNNKISRIVVEDPRKKKKKNEASTSEDEQVEEEINNKIERLRKSKGIDDDRKREKKELPWVKKKKDGTSTNRKCMKEPSIKRKDEKLDTLEEPEPEKKKRCFSIGQLPALGMEQKVRECRESAHSSPSQGSKPEKRACPAKYTTTDSSIQSSTTSRQRKRACPAKYTLEEPEPEEKKRCSSIGLLPALGMDQELSECRESAQSSSGSKLEKRACPAKYTSKESSFLASTASRQGKRASPSKYDHSIGRGVIERTCPAKSTLFHDDRNDVVVVGSGKDGVRIQEEAGVRTRDPDKEQKTFARAKFTLKPKSSKLLKQQKKKVALNESIRRASRQTSLVELWSNERESIKCDLLRPSNACTVDIVEHVTVDIGEHVNNSPVCYRENQFLKDETKMKERGCVSSSSEYEVVGEEKRDFTKGVKVTCGETSKTAPSTSGAVTKGRKKKRNMKRLEVDPKIESGTESDHQTGPSSPPRSPPRRRVRCKTGKVTRKGILTSTPITVGKGRAKRRNVKKKEDKEALKSQRTLLDMVKRKLDEGLHIELSEDESTNGEGAASRALLEFESTGSSLREALRDGTIEDFLLPKRACPAEYCTVTNCSKDHVSTDDEHLKQKRACPAKYDGASDCYREHLCAGGNIILQQKRACPAKYDTVSGSSDKGKQRKRHISQTITKYSKHTHIQ